VYTTKHPATQVRVITTRVLCYGTTGRSQCCSVLLIRHELIRTLAEALRTGKKALIPWLLHTDVMQVLGRKYRRERVRKALSP
jgi:hypothetical protein